MFFLLLDLLGMGHGCALDEAFRVRQGTGTGDGRGEKRGGEGRKESVEGPTTPIR